MFKPYLGYADNISCKNIPVYFCPSTQPEFRQISSYPRVYCQYLFTGSAETTNAANMFLGPALLEKVKKPSQTVFHFEGYTGLWATNRDPTVYGEVGYLTQMHAYHAYGTHPKDGKAPLQCSVLFFDNHVESHDGYGKLENNYRNGERVFGL